MPGLVPGLSFAQSLGDAGGCSKTGGQAEQGHTHACAHTHRVEKEGNAGE